jgi:hypothetical protein
MSLYEDINTIPLTLFNPVSKTQLLTTPEIYWLISLCLSMSVSAPARHQNTRNTLQTNAETTKPIQPQPTHMKL